MLMSDGDFPVKKADSEWKESLTPEQYKILREKGTEAPFTGEYCNNHAEGVYRCAGCGEILFDSKHKFDSGSGWPSFDRPMDEDKLATEVDESLGMVRTEVMCSKCGGHLGHVFLDGPAETTGQRFCVNSAALDFEEK